MAAVGRQVLVWWGGTEHDHKYDCYLYEGCSYFFTVSGVRAGPAVFRSFDGSTLVIERPGSEPVRYQISQLIQINSLPAHGLWG